MFIVLGMYVALHQCVADPWLDELYGGRSANRVTLCAGGGVACDGAVWERRWVLARDSCLHDTNASELNVWKGEVNCSDGEQKISPQNTVVVRYKPTNLDDVALLLLRLAYPAGEPITNKTRGHLFTKLANYVSEIKEPHEEKLLTNEMYYTYQYRKNTSSPIKIFLLTVVLPSAAFMVFFIFVIFFTGSSKSYGAYRPLLHTVEN